MSIQPSLLILLLSISALFGTGMALGLPDEAALCDQAADLAAQYSGTPFEVLQAISRVETGRDLGGEIAPWPWAVNYAGKGYWFQSQKEAYDFAQALLAQGEDNFDLGCFQVNQHWHGAKFTSLTEALSPGSNAAVAAAYLQAGFQRSGSWGAAVAAYHSKSEAAGQQYLIKVEAMLQRLRGDPPVPPLAQLAQIEAANPFPLLRLGGVVNGASLVPIDAPAIPLIRMTK